MTWLADEGVSGAVPPEARKRFKAALALMEAGESEALIVTKVDRGRVWSQSTVRRLLMREGVQRSKEEEGVV